MLSTHNTCTVNLPKPPVLLGRLLVMAGHPGNGQGRGEHVLACMKALGPNIKEEVVNMWDTVIPKLQAYISGELRHIIIIITSIIYYLLSPKQLVFY